MEESLPQINQTTISNLLQTQTIGKVLSVHDQLESTNQTAKEAPVQHGEVIVAKEQTAGRGRMGRPWHSSAKKAVAMSLVLVPSPSFSKPYVLTHLTAAALSNALLPLTDSFIKWPNDIWIDSSKLAGILTETQYIGSVLESIVIGLGININQEKADFQNESLHDAISLRIATGSIINPNSIIASFLNEFEKLYNAYVSSGNPEPFLSTCRSRSNVIGKTVWVHQGSSKRKVTVLNIGTEGELIVLDRNTQEIDSFYGGEVSIRGIH